VTITTDISTSNTFGSIIDEVIFHLQGFVEGEQTTWLEQDITETDTVIPVGNAAGFSKGIIEIGTELVRVVAVDPTMNTLTCSPMGRGFRTSVKAAHSSGELVTYNPSWPKATVGRKVNEIVETLYPMLYGVLSAEIDGNGYDYTWPLPEDAEGVVDVRWRGHLHADWQRVRAWEFKQGLPVSDFPSGKGVILPRGLGSTQRLQVLYAAKPTPMANLSDDFIATTGLPASVRQVVTLGVAVQLTQFLDVARLRSHQVSPTELTEPTSAAAVAGALGRQFQARLEEERRALHAKYPISTHKVR